MRDTPIARETKKIDRHVPLKDLRLPPPFPLPSMFFVRLKSSYPQGFNGTSTRPKPIGGFPSLSSDFSGLTAPNCLSGSDALWSRRELSHRRRLFGSLGKLLRGPLVQRRRCAISTMATKEVNDSRMPGRDKENEQSPERDIGR